MATNKYPNCGRTLSTTIAEIEKTTGELSEGPSFITEIGMLSGSVKASHYYYAGGITVYLVTINGIVWCYRVTDPDNKFNHISLS